MQTAWNGLALPTLSENVVLTEAYQSWSVPLLLQDTPQIATVVHLPSLTFGLIIWSYDAPIWFALNAMPEPIAPLQAASVAADQFVLGHIVNANQGVHYTIPDGTMPNTLYLLAQDASVRVAVTALRRLDAGPP
jgi:hypothetical protein